MPRATKLPPVAEFMQAKSEGTRFGEAKDCAVIALSMVADVSYEAARDALAREGRRSRRGTYMRQSLDAARALGFATKEVDPIWFINQYPGAHCNLRHVTSHHADRFNRVWANGKNYFLVSARHIWAVKNGVNCDWSRGRSLRVWRIFEVTKET